MKKVATRAIWLVGLLGCGPVPADSPPDSPAEDDSGEDSPPTETGPVDEDGDGWSPGPRWNDCDDHDPTIHPGATEIPDGIDQNCNGEIDEGTELYDDDDDGYTEVDGDCNDSDRHIFVGAPDYYPCDGVDQSCMGLEEPCVSLDGAFAKVVGDDALAYAVVGDVDMTGDGRADVLTFNGDLHVWEIPETGGQYTYNERAGTVYAPLLGTIDMIAVVGDVDLDGFVEVAFGNSSGRGPGYVYIVSAPLLGGSNVETAAIATLTDGQISGFGLSLDAGQDASGDGVVDILVGADADAQYTGTVYLFSGDVRGEVPMDAAIARVLGDAVNDAVGASVRFSGDNNGDGVGDVLVGGSGHEGQASQVAWFAGPLEGSQSILDGELVLNDPGMALELGVCSESADVDGDGRDDLLLQTWDLCTGRVYLFTQVPSVGLEDAVARVDGREGCSNFGSSASMEDANGDGLDDLIVGDDTSQLGGHYTEPRLGTPYGSGAVALYLAPFSGVHSFWDAAAVWAGEHGADSLGQDVSSAGDFNGDGFEDFLFAAPYYGDPEDPDQAFSGAAYLMLGQAEW